MKIQMTGLSRFGFPQIAWDKPNEGEGATGADEAAAVAAAAAEAEAAAAAELAAAEEAEAAALAAAEAGDEAGDDPVKLKAEKAALLKDVMKKKTALKAAEKTAADAAARLAEFDGLDPAEVKALVQAKKDADKAAAEAAGDFERVKTMMAEEHAKEKKVLEDQVAELNTQLQGRDATIDNLTIGSDFSGSKYIHDNLTTTPTKTRILYGKHFEVQDGKTVAYDKPAGEANRTMLVDASGNPLGFDAAIKKIVEADPDKDSMLKAKTTPGAGGKTVLDGNGKAKPAAGDDKLYGRSRLAATLGDLINS